MHCDKCKYHRAEMINHLKQTWTDHVECPLKFLGPRVISETIITKELRWSRFTARCYASAVLAVALCLSVRHKSEFYKNE